MQKNMQIIKFENQSIQKTKKSPRMFQTQLYLKEPLRECTCQATQTKNYLPGRLKRLRTELHRHNVTAAVIFDPINVRCKIVRAGEDVVGIVMGRGKGKLKYFLEPGINILNEGFGVEYS